MHQCKEEKFDSFGRIYDNARTEEVVHLSSLLK